MTKTIDPPRISDGIETKPNNAPQNLVENTLEKLGKTLYRHRTGANRRVKLRKMPKGYSIVNLSTQHQSAQIKGHPSGQIFPSIATFVPHLLWLETRHKKSTKNMKMPCVCTNCCDPPVVPERPVEEERKEYLVRPLAKVVIESFEWSNSFCIPLPALIQPDPRVLRKSNKAAV